MNGIVGAVGDAGRRDLFYLDEDFHLKQRTWNGQEWVIQWIDHGGIFTSVPAVVSRVDTHRPIVVGDLGDLEDLTVDESAGPAPGHGPGHVPPTHLPTTPLTPAGGLAPLEPALPTPAPVEPVPGGGPGVEPWVGHGPFGPEVTEQRIDVFGLGLDYAMYTKTLWGGAGRPSGPWRRLEGVFTSAPAAIWLGDELHVLGLGVDLGMYWRTRTRSGWTPGWQRVGGYFSSPPVVVSWGPGRFDVFARGADFSLRRRRFESGAWDPEWQNLGGNLASAPAVASWGPDRLDVVAVGHRDGATPDGGLVHRWWDGDIWNDWEQIAGRTTGDDVAFTSAPAIATRGPGRLDVCAIDTAGTLRHIAFGDGAWSDPTPVSPVQQMRSTPMLLATGPDEVEVITPGVDRNLWRKTLTAGTWEPVNFWQLGDHVRLPSQYRFSIDLVRVDTARSFNNDTVTGQCTLAVGSWPTRTGRDDWPLRTRTQRLGKMGGTSPDEGQTNLLSLDPVTIELHESAAFGYTFVNSDEPEDVVSAALQGQAERLAEWSGRAFVKAAAGGVGLTKVEVGDLSAPITGPLLGLLGGWFGEVLRALVEDACDGAVAAENFVRRGDELHRVTAGGPVTMRVRHHGSNSPTLCGAESDYVVTWTIARSRL